MQSGISQKTTHQERSPGAVWSLGVTPAVESNSSTGGHSFQEGYSWVSQVHMEPRAYDPTKVLRLVIDGAS